MRAARFPATPRPPGARLCARDKATLGAFGASEALMVCEASKGAFLCAFQCECGAGLPEPLICRESGGGPLPHEAAAGRVVSRDGSMAQLHTGTVMRAMFAGSIALWSKAATIAKVRPRPRPGPDRPSSQLAPFLCSFRPADRVTSRDCPPHRPEAAWLPRLRSPPRERVPRIPATRPLRPRPRSRSEPRSRRAQNTKQPTVHQTRTKRLVGTR
jgi:hypothetical protein